MMKMKKVFYQISKMHQKIHTKCFEKLCLLATFLTCNPLTSFAIDTSNNANITDWPWTRFLNSLVREMTGPIPMFIGIIGIVGAVGAMITGNFGASVQKLLAIIFGVSIAIFAPSFIGFISGSVTNTNGLTIFLGM